MSQENVSKKVIRNTAFNALGQIWMIVIALLLTPYIINHLGLERFGAWVIVGVVTGYFGLLDCGIGSVFVKYFSEYYAKKDYETINSMLSTGLLFYVLLSILIIPIGLFLAKGITVFLNVPLEFQKEAVFTLKLGIVVFVMSLCLAPFKSIQTGMQRMDITNKITIARSLPLVIGTIFVLERGYGLIGLMCNSAFIVLLEGLADIVVAFKLFQKLKIKFSLCSTRIFKKLFDFGYKWQIARLSSMISVHVDKLLISYFLSIGLVSFYQLGSAIIEKCKSVILLLMSALMPAFSEMDALDQRERLIEGYIVATKYISLITLPLFFFVIFTARDIMNVWLGPGYEQSILIIRILGVGWLIAILSGMRSVVLQAIARPDIEMAAGLIGAVLNIFLSTIFVLKIGFKGIALGTAMGLVFSAAYGSLKLHKLLKLGIWNFIKSSIISGLLITTISASLAWVITGWSKNLLSVEGRFVSLGSLAIFGCIFYAVYFISLFIAKPFRNREIMLVAQYMPLPIKKLILNLSR